MAARMHATNTLRRSVVPAFINEWLDRTDSDRRVNVLVSGASGMGKSHVATSLLDAARRRGFTTVFAAPSPAGIPFQLLAQLTPNSPPPAALESAHLFWLARLALAGQAEAHTPIAVVFEDIDSYEVSDLAFVRDLVASTTPTNIVTFLTCRSDSEPRSGAEPRPPYVDRFIEAFPRLPNCERWELDPLTLREATEFVTVRFGRLVAPRTVRDLLALAGRNASYLDHLVRGIEALPEQDRAAVLSGSRSAEELRLPDSIRPFLRADLSALEAEQTSVIEALAIWAMPGDVRLLSVLTGLDERAVTDALDSLERIGLIRSTDWAEGLRFAVSSTLTSRLLAEEAPALSRQQVHRRASEILDQRAPTLSPAERIRAARHYLASAVPPSEIRAAAVADAARHLISRSRFDSAHELLTGLSRQLEAAAAPMSAEALILLAETELPAGTSRDVGRALSSIVDHPEHEGDRSTAIATLIRSARDHLGRGDDEGALSIYQRLVREHELSAAQRAAALLDSGLLERQVGQPAEAMRSFDRATTIADELGLSDISIDADLGSGQALLERAMPADAMRHMRQAYSAARAAGQPPGIARALAGVGGVVALDRSVHRATRWLRRATRVAERCEDYAIASWSGELLAEAYIETGDWGRARTVIDAVIQVGEDLHRGRSQRRAVSLRRMLDALEGRSATLETGSDATDGDVRALGGPSDRVAALAARFEHHLLRGEHEAAAATIERARRMLHETAGWERLLALEVLPRCARAAARLGARDDLASVVEELGQLLDRPGDPVPLFEAERASADAHLAVLDRRFGAAVTLASDAARTFTGLGYRWRGSLATKQAGHAALLARNQPQASELLEAAYLSFQEFGATAQTSETLELLHQLGRRAPHAHRASSTLTARQWEVAELLSERLTDAEIAQRLQISRRTVTTHVHNVLQALQLHSRVDVQHWYEAERSRPPASQAAGWVLGRTAARDAG